MPAAAKRHSIHAALDGVVPRKAMESALQREEVRFGTARAPGVLELVPCAKGLVLRVPRRQVLRGSAQQRSLLQALHAQRLATLTLGACEPRILDTVMRWLAERPDMAALPLGLWLDRTLAMPAFSLALQHPARVGAVVTVNAQLDTDLTGLPRVNAATLLLLLGAHAADQELHRRAMALLQCVKRLEKVPLPASGVARAGTVDAVAEIASAWLARHLTQRRLL
jgi:hypothetical protein